MHRHSPVPLSPNTPLAAGITCLAVSVLMSLTFFEPNWENAPTVVVVLALMVVGALGGLALLTRGLTLSRQLARLGDLSLETPREDLRPGETFEYVLRVEASGALVLDAVVLEWVLSERAAVEGGSMEVAVAEVLREEVRTEVGRELDPGEGYEIRGTLTLPADAPATFRVEHHTVEMLARVTLEGPRLGGLVRSFFLEVEPVLEGERPVVPAPGQVPEDLYTRSAADGVEVALSLDLPKDPAGLHEVEAGARVEGEVTWTADAPAGIEGGMVDLVWMADGGFLDAESVAASEPFDGGPVEPDAPRTARFALEVPDDLPHSWVGRKLEVSWGLRVTPTREIQPTEAIEYFPLRVLPRAASAAAEQGTG